MQLGDPRRTRGRRGDPLVGEAADLRDDGRDAGRRVGPGDGLLPVRVEEDVTAERSG